ncbi:MAG: 4-phosphoerythronate dehydrogenase [Deltaproteobacteria bacterium]|nr:4-phosphoerythronate dehydrogenase [Deltaproteobacteria bacterium]
MRIIADQNITFASEAFKDLGDVALVPSKEINAGLVKSADALFIRTATKVDKELVEGSRLKFIGSASVGTDHVDFQALRKLKITFASAAGCSARAVAEFVLCNWFAFNHRHGLSHLNQLLGIVGFGHVGQELYRLAERLDIRCLIHDPFKEVKIKNQRFYPLETLRREADVISLHVPLTKNGIHPTLRMIDEPFFQDCKSSLIIINTSRGGIINEQIMRKYRNRFLGLIIDVFENEPDISLTTLGIADIATPHIAGYSIQAKVSATSIVHQAACRLFKLKPSWRPQDSIRNQLIEVILQRKQNNIYEILSLIYPLYKDDLKQLDSSKQTSLADYFSAYRNNYVFRDEFSSFKMSNSKLLEKFQIAQLKALGIQLDC